MAYRWRLCPVGVAALVFCASAFGQSVPDREESGQALADRIAERRDAALSESRAVPPSIQSATADQPQAQAAATPSAAGVQVGDKQIDSATGRVVAGDPLQATGEELVIPEVQPRAEELLPLGRVPSELPMQSGEPAMPSLGGGWVMNTMAALGVVIGLILALRWIAKRSGAVKTASLESPAVEMLSRTTIAPRNHVVLLRIGPRVLVVNDSGQGMRTLANIDDPDEVAELLRSVQMHQDNSASKSFAGVMSKLSRGADRESDYGDSAEASVGQARDSLAGLRGRLASMSTAARGGSA